MENHQQIINALYATDHKMSAKEREVKTPALGLLITAMKQKGLEVGFVINATEE